MKNQKLAIGLVLLVFIIALLILFQEKKGKKPIVKIEKQGITYNLKFGHDMPTNSAQHIAALKYAERVEQKTKGQVHIRVYPNQELGTDEEMIEAARRGKLDIILPPTAKLSTLVPELQLIDLPFLFSSREEAYPILDGKPGKHLLELLEPQGLIGFTFWESGFKQFTANKEIRTPEDFKGLNIRVMKSRLIMEQFKAFGANPIPIDFGQTYNALKNKVVDGQENSLVSIANLKFFEIQSHIILSSHSYLSYVFCMSKTNLERLPGEIRSILVKTALEITPFQREETLKKEKEFIQVIENSGTKIVQLQASETALFWGRVQDILIDYQSQFPQIIPWEDLKISQKVSANEDIIIGLDADVVSASAPSGLAIKRGMELAVVELNLKGGVLGKKLSIIVRDNSGISARGIENIIYFSKLKNIVAVMGGLHSPVALSELNSIHENKIIYLGPWAAATGITENSFQPNYVFRVSVRDEYAGEFLVNKALESHQNIALLLENTGWGRSNERSMTKALKDHQKTPVAIEWFNWGDTNMMPQLTRIENAGADAILMVANAPEGSIIIKNASQRSQKTSIYSHWGITGGYFWNNVKNELPKVKLKFLQTFSFAGIKNKKTREVSAKYLAQYGIDDVEDILAPVGTAHAYDLVHLLAKAIEKAGSLDRSKIRDAFETIQFHEGLVKNYKNPFTPEDHDALGLEDFFLAEYDTKGFIVPIN